MRLEIFIAGAATALLAIGVLASGNKPDHKTASDGPTIFTEQKCNSCHSIDIAGISRKPESVTNTSKTAPDLSDVGTRHDAQWIAKFLQKQETIEGRKHMIAFRGDEAQLAEITTWLSTLKGKQSKGAGD